MTAVWRGHLDIVQFLLSVGADTSATLETGYTALLVAADALRDDIVEALLKAGASLTATTPEGRNALNLAIANDRRATRIVQMILDTPEGPSLIRQVATIQNFHNITPLHLCAEQNCGMYSLFIIRLRMILRCCTNSGYNETTA